VIGLLKIAAYSDLHPTTVNVHLKQLQALTIIGD
jgi:hypothetical protein